MPVEVIMPKVDMDMATGRIVKWHVAEGAQVEKSAALFDIETDKATMEVEAPAAGRLHHVRAAEGEDVAVGAPVAWLYAEGEAVGPAPGAAAPPETPQPAPAADAPEIAAPTPAAPSAEHRGAVRATPLARRLARENGVDLAATTGTSLNGRITSADVVASRRARAPEPPLSPRAEAPPAAPRAEAQGPLSLARSCAGDGAPILLIHGFAADATGWAGLERLLPAGNPVWKLDLPGHGRSPRLPVAGFADLAQIARTALDATGEGPVHLVGHSLGGAVALALADTRPRRVASLTLISPAGLGPEIDGATLLGIARATRADSLAPWLKRLTADPDAISWNYVLAAMAARRDPDLRAAQAAMADALFPDGTQGFDLAAALHRLEAPARIAFGRSDRVIPWRHALRAPGRVGLHLYDATGHLPHIERADEIAMLVTEMTQRPAPG